MAKRTVTIHSTTTNQAYSSIEVLLRLWKKASGKSPPALLSDWEEKDARPNGVPKKIALTIDGI